MYIYPLSSSAFWYSGAAASTISLLDDSSDRRLLMPSVISRSVTGGWLYLMFMYLRVLSGFM